MTVRWTTLTTLEQALRADYSCQKDDDSTTIVKWVLAELHSLP